ncbi:hypothetical protein [Paenibacillus xylanilyticus]|uniref:Uncharacterized protein n=1 Tax=Paenibacillus xylanilyticus TaxID=248903 RepID=A0A7Y6C050_9BACL|nr:hypothetical protein [Paenibacillus xylanilyticus]NUU78021.1 hypothetical protein [Paenibacillus xylanilyticus]
MRMSYERDRTVITTPQAHDINDIKSYRNSASSTSESDLYNPIPHADWPEFNFEDLVTEQSDIVVHVKVIDTQSKPHVDGQPQAQLATLEILDTIKGNSHDKIVLDQALDYVEKGKTYIMLLRQQGDYFYESDKNSVIKEVDGLCTSNIPDFKGSFTELKDFESAFDSEQSSLN